MTEATAEKETLTVSLGPQHPATHGVLRILAELDGETIVSAKCVMGYLHRGTEKTAEHKSYSQFIPYTDRLDYLSPLTNNIAYCLAVEKLFGLDIPPRATWLRTALAEVSRLESHLVAYGSHAMDLGAWTAFLYSFREREKLYDLLEIYSGQRMQNSALRVGGLFADAPESFLDGLHDWAREFRRKHLPELHTLLTKNPIWKSRTVGVAVLKPGVAKELCLTGPLVRGSGVPYDLRKAEPTLAYDKVDFELALEDGCDTYARYLVRMKEMEESAKIVLQCVEKLPEGDVLARHPDFIPPQKDEIYSTMENTIRHFKLASEGPKPPVGEAYVGFEGPKGELGFYVVSDGTAKPYRVRIRPPSFINLQALEELAPGMLVSDLIALIGTIDIVLGEVDR